MKKLLFLFSFVYCFGALEDFNVGTWNLQGSSAASTESKWTISIRQLVTGDNPLDILMVQEAGTLPATATLTGRHVQQGGTPIDEYIWNLGTLSRPNQVFIYYSRVDVGANRVNLAIVSRTQADEVIVLPPPTVASRPLIGIRIGNDVFFNVHALANNGTDAAAAVTSVDMFATTRGIANLNWMVAGDFNREPLDTLTGLDRDLRRRVALFFPPSFTQTTSQRTIDYAITGNSNTQTTYAIPSLSAVLMFAGLRTYLASDHFPVNFRRF